MITVGIDWNNTIQDQISELVGLSGGKLTHQDFAVWDDPSGAKKMEMPEKDFIAWCWKSQGVQEMALPFPGVKEALERMKSEGWTIKIITHSFMPASKIIAWFDKHKIPFDEIVKAKDKSQVSVDFYIDLGFETDVETEYKLDVAKEAFEYLQNQFPSMSGVKSFIMRNAIIHYS